MNEEKQLSKEQTRHKATVVMAHMGHVDMKGGKLGNEIVYKCNVLEHEYEVIVRRINGKEE